MKHGNASPDPTHNIRTAAEFAQAGRFVEAEAICRQILAANPRNADALHLLGFSALQEGRYDEAVKSIRKAIKIKNDFAFFYNNLAFALQNLGRHGEAITEYRRALRLKPDLAEAHMGIGDGFRSQKKFDDAAEAYEQALAVNPGLAEAHVNLGHALKAQGKTAEAAARYERALAVNPALADAHNNLGLLLHGLGKFDEAVVRYEQGIAAKPEAGTLAAICTNLGATLQAQGKSGEAVARFRQALAADPDLAAAHYNLAGILKSQDRTAEALEHYEKAVALKEDFPPARNNLGIILHEMGRFDEAAAHYEQGLGANPDPDTLAMICSNLGSTLHALDRLDEAVARHLQAIAVRPDMAGAHCNLATAYRDQNKLAETVAHYTKAFSIDPGHAEALSHMVHHLQHAADWSGIGGHEAALLDMVRRDTPGIPPFAVLCAASSPAEQLSCAVTHSRQFEVPAADVFRHVPGPRREKLHVGYLSSDFHQHATACLMAGLFETHDRARFEISGWSYGTDDGSDMRQRLTRGFDRFTDLRRVPHGEAARQINEAGVDILVDLKGYTGGGRPRIDAFRPAPVQVNYLGYPGTMGAPFIDYIIADPFILPMDQQSFYTEKIVHLPHCYQPNDTARKIAEATPTRAECGLPETGFVFCSFNNVYKITPRVFDIWMRLLKAVPGSVLWQLNAHGIAADNLRREAAVRGVDPARLVFAARMPLEDHLARQRLADLFLDTLPVNAHTTASDALWAGLPVLTCAGETFISRVAGSLLVNCGLPELVTRSLEDYEALALRLAQDPERLAALRRKLKENIPTAPLFDIGRFSRDIEKAYLGMWDIWLAGEKPRGFAV